MQSYAKKIHTATLFLELLQTIDLQYIIQDILLYSIHGVEPETLCFSNGINTARELIPLLKEPTEEKVNYFFDAFSLSEVVQILKHLLVQNIKNEDCHIGGLKTLFDFTSALTDISFNTENTELVAKQQAAANNLLSIAGV
jgi:hypothetical protein